MSKLPILEVPEGSVPIDNAGPAHLGRGVVTYRCKVLRALLDITSASEYRQRSMVLKSGRRIDGVASQSRQQ